MCDSKHVPGRPQTGVCQLIPGWKVKAALAGADTRLLEETWSCQRTGFLFSMGAEYSASGTLDFFYSYDGNVDFFYSYAGIFYAWTKARTAPTCFVFYAFVGKHTFYLHSWFIPLLSERAYAALAHFFYSAVTLEIISSNACATQG